MKNYILPDYSDIDSIFFVSTIGNRGELFFEEQLKLILLIDTIIKYPINIIFICNDFDSKQITESKISKFNFINLKIDYFVCKISDIWIRDYFTCGNIINENKELSSLKAIYNPSYNYFYSFVDDSAGIQLCKKYFENCKYLNFKLDGGNIISNEKYLFISEKLYTENLNLSKKEIDNYFENNFEQELITIPTENLDTIGHTDSIVRFLDSKTIALSIYDEEYRVDNRYIMKVKNLILNKIGLDYKIIFIPSYLDDYINDDNIFSAYGLYINFLRIENNIIFPSFEGLESYEKEIRKIMNKEMPYLNIYFSPCNLISKEGGCFNCITSVKYKI